MSQQELLKQVVQVLSETGIDYLVTGSIASSLQGEPRSTHDIDLVVALTPEGAKSLVRAFPPPDYYLSEDAIVDAVRTQSMFNLLLLTEGEKVDFWILTKDPFDESRFARKRIEEVFGIRLAVSAPEDTILAKLKWAKLSGGSEKQLTDALRVYEIQAPLLDRSYLDHWAQHLEVVDLWQQIQAEAELA